MLRPTKIRALYCQMVGRGTRLCPGKDNLLILDFLWLSKRHNLCRPASLISESEEDIEKVKKASQEDEIDLFGAVSDAEEQRRQALARALEEKAGRKSKLINPLEVFDILDDIGLADYEPVFEWEEADATAKQIEALEHFGVDAEGITKGYACKILGRLIGRCEQNKATVKQIRLLRQYGYDPIDWSFEQASRYIGALRTAGWKKWRMKI